MNTTSYHNTLEQALSNLETRSKNVERRSIEPWATILAEIALKNILTHLPPGRVLRVLDIGDGRCWYAIEMAKRGCFVELVCSNDNTIETARRLIVTAGMGERIRVSRLDIVNELANYRPASFNVVFAHLLLEYLPDYPRLIEQISSLLKQEGLLSVVYENRYATAIRMTLKGLNPRATLEFLTQQDRIVETSDAEGFTLDPEQVKKVAERSKLSILAEYGLGVFTEYANEDKLRHNADFADSLLELERTASQMPQYRGIARYRHLLAKKP